MFERIRARLRRGLPALRGAPGASPRRRRGLEARRLGRRGEQVAARALRRAGYRILGRNLRTPHGEVDLLAREGGALVVVEVKTRRLPAPGEPPLRRRVLGASQRDRLRRAAAWLGRRAGSDPRRVRRDLVTVTFAGCRSLVTIRRGFF
ncbi:MAG: YraN family protein [Planctomycetota bacterium]